MSTSKSKESAAKRGVLPALVVVGACAACCAGPVLAVVGGVGGALAAVGFLVWPVVGIGVAATTVVSVLWLRRRRIGGAKRA